MPAIAPGLRPERGVTAAAAALVVEAGAAVEEAVGDALEDEELALLAPGGTDSSGNFYSCQLVPSFYRPEEILYLAWL